MTNTGISSLSRTGAHAIGERKLLDRAILLVEADIWLALTLQSSLAEAGAVVVTAGTLAKALQLAERPKLAAAVIDDALEAEAKSELVGRLTKREVPFLFHSGRRSDDFRECTEATPGAGPVDIDRIGDAVADLVGQRSRSARMTAAATAYARSGESRQLKR